MPNSLITFWSQLKRDSNPFIHPCDLNLLEKQRRWVVSHLSWDEFISQPEWNTPRNLSKLQVSLIPVPYSGDILNAQIVILMLNPGFLPFNVWVEKTVSDWTDTLWKNLNQSFDNKRVPFIFLDPQFAWHPGFIYWSSRFRKTLLQIMKSQKCSYPEALKWLGRRVACLQLVPYASASFGLPYSLIQSLPSARQARDFVGETLLVQALKGDKTLIAARQIKTWDLREGKNIIELKDSCIRGARIESNLEVLSHLWGKLGL